MFEKWYSVIFITLLPPFPLVKGGNNKNLRCRSLAVLNPYLFATGLISDNWRNSSRVKDLISSYTMF